MTPINLLKKFKKKLKKVSIISIFCLTAVSSQINAYMNIPLEGLFSVLKHDDIGFGHVLMHSKWIERMYQHAEGKPSREVPIKKGRKTTWKVQDKNDAVANLIRKLWFRKSKDNQLLPTQFGFLANIPNASLGTFFGKLINYVYIGLDERFEQDLINDLLLYDQKDTANDELTKLKENWEIEKLKLSDKRFAGLEDASKVFRKEVKQLEKEFKIKIFKNKLKKTKKQYRRNKKQRAQEIKELEKQFKKDEFDAAIESAEKEAFKAVSKKVFNEREEYKKIARVVGDLEKKINAKVSQKRQAIQRTLLDPIKKSLKFCSTNKMYLPRTTQAILWALFFHKLDNLISLEEKVIAINNCLNIIDKEFRCPGFQSGVKLQKLYTGEDFVVFERKFKNFRWNRVGQVLKNYDIGLYSFINDLAGKNFPPKISEARYGYEYEEGKISNHKHNCHEAAILDALSMLWYNKKKKAFDDSLFPEKVLQDGQGLKRLREALKYFYLADKKGIKSSEYTYGRYGIFTSLAKLKKLGKITVQEVNALDISEVPVEYINRSVIKQEFMNIVAGLPGIRYVGTQKFEVKSDPNNVRKLFNYFYGTNVQNIEHLGDEISTEKRKIKIEKGRNYRGHDLINFSVIDFNKSAFFTMMITVRSSHTFTEVPKRDNPLPTRLKRDFAIDLLKGLNLENSDISRRISIFASLVSKDLLKRRVNKLSLLNLIYYSFNMKDPVERFELIKEMLERNSTVEHYREVVDNLVETFPADNQAITNELGEYIVRNDLYKRESLKKFVDKVFVNNPEFYCTDNVVNILEKALQKGYKDLILDVLEKSNCYNCVIKFRLMAALQKGWVDVVLKVVSNSNCNLEECDEKGLLAFALTQGYMDLAVAIIKNPSFNTRYCEIEDALMIALAQGYTDIALKIVNHYTFDASRARVEDVLDCALHKGYQDIFYAIIKANKFIYWSHAFGGALDKWGKEAALELLENPRFNVWGYVLGEALERGWKDVALHILNNPKCTFKHSPVEHGLIAALKRASIESSVRFRLGMQQTELLKNDWRNIVLRTIRHYSFDMSKYKEKELLRRLLECGYRTAAIEMVTHPKFDMSRDELKRTLNLAIKEGNQEIMTEFVNDPKFDNEYRLNRFKLFVMLGYKESALSILKNPQFNQDIKKVLDALTFVFERGTCTDVAISFIKNLAHSQDLEKVFLKAFETIKLVCPNEQNQDILGIVKSHEAVALAIIEYSKKSNWLLKIRGLQDWLEGYVDLVGPMVKNSAFDKSKERNLGFVKKLTTGSFEVEKYQKFINIMEFINSMDCKKGKKRVNNNIYF